MKRFYRQAAAVQEGGVWGVRLDGKGIKTPAKAALGVPTQALALAIAAEWNSQGETVKPKTMPLMRLACTAIDWVGPGIGPSVDEIAAYGKSDLLCYRAAEPPDLVARQDALWQPWLDWAARELGTRLVCTVGIGAVDQSPEALAALRAAVAAVDAFRLTALHALVTGYGSLVLGLAVLRGAAAPEAAWAAARCDETYQEERWGADAEAAARVRNLKADIDAALHFAAALTA